MILHIIIVGLRGMKSRKEKNSRPLTFKEGGEKHSTRNTTENATSTTKLATNRIYFIDINQLQCHLCSLQQLLGWFVYENLKDSSMC